MPSDIRDLADKNYQLLKSDPRFWSVRIGLHYRALGVPVDDGVYWIWIGTHADYDKIVA